MKLSEVKIDVERQEQGGWVDNIPEMGDVRLKVRGINNADWRRMQAKLFEAVPRAKKPGGRIDPDEQDRITTQLLGATVLLDWSGIENEDGSALTYSSAVASKMLADPEMRRFRDAVVWAATQVAERQSEDRKDIVGN